MEDDPLEPKTQGAILLQSMLRLGSPHNEIVIDRYDGQFTFIFNLVILTVEYRVLPLVFCQCRWKTC